MGTAASVSVQAGISVLVRELVFSYLSTGPQQMHIPTSSNCIYES